MQGTRHRKAPANAVAAGPVVLDALEGAMRPTLYLDIVGTLVLQDGAHFKLAPFARDFIDAVKDRFKMIFLTSLTESTARDIADVLGIKVPYGIYRRGLGKVSGIDFSRPFLWVDDAPTSRDLMRLAEERCSGQLITVNGKDGVTRLTLKKVEACLETIGAGHD
jgi:hypothetical protein